MGKTKIEWATDSWNPIRARNLATGGIGHFCEHVSEGCRNCYAERLQPRFGNPVRYARQDRDKVEIFLDEQTLLAPLRWKKPRMIFPSSMTDLFGEWVPDEWIDKVFAVMALAPQHMFQVLTKRPKRMRRYCSSADHAARWLQQIDAMASWSVQMCRATRRRPTFEAMTPNAALTNVWLGVSVEDQPAADERIPDLLATPAALRWVSYEPALGPVDLTRLCLLPKKQGSPRPGISIDALRGRYNESGMDYVGDWDINGPYPAGAPARKLDWIVCGGESGPGARPMHPAWARSVRDQCAAAGVPFFFKQWGEFRPPTRADELCTHGVFPNGDVYHAVDLMVPGRIKSRAQDDRYSFIVRVGRRAAGRLLDGVEHNSMPEDPSHA